MTDHSQRLLLEVQGFAASLEAGHVETLRMLALQLDGHPKAQDFEPSGHGGGEARSPLRFDKQGWPQADSQAEGKKYTKAIQRAWEALREADDIRRRQLKAERSQEPLDPSDPNEWCVLHLEIGDYAPRYRMDLCRPCAERKYQTGDYPSKADIRHHTMHGRWPRKAEDPDSPTFRTAGQPRESVGRRIAGLENLVEGVERIEEA